MDIDDGEPIYQQSTNMEGVEESTEVEEGTQMDSTAENTEYSFRKGWGDFEVNDPWPSCVERLDDGCLVVDFSTWHNNPDAATIPTDWKKQRNFPHPLGWDIIRRLFLEGDTGKQIRGEIMRTIASMPIVPFVMYTPTLYLMLYGIANSPQQASRDSKDKHKAQRVSNCFEVLNIYYLFKHILTKAPNGLDKGFVEERLAEYENQLESIYIDFSSLMDNGKSKNLKEAVWKFWHSGFKNIPTDTKYKRAITEYVKQMICFTMNIMWALETLIFRLMLPDTMKIGTTTHRKFFAEFAVPNEGIAGHAKVILDIYKHMKEANTIREYLSLSYRIKNMQLREYMAKRKTKTDLITFPNIQFDEIPQQRIETVDIQALLVKLYCFVFGPDLN